MAKLCARVVSSFSWLTGCTFKANLSNVTSPPRSSSSSSSAPVSEHSRLHKLTPLWTILRTHPRCVETKVMGPKVDASSIVPHGAMSTLVDLPGVPIPWRTIDGCSKNARVVLALARCPNRRSRLFAITEVTGVDLFYVSPPSYSCVNA